jgi:hypothetical protein
MFPLPPNLAATIDATHPPRFTFSLVATDSGYAASKSRRAVPDDSAAIFAACETTDTADPNREPWRERPRCAHVQTPRPRPEWVAHAMADTVARPVLCSACVCGSAALCRRGMRTDMPKISGLSVSKIPGRTVVSVREISTTSCASCGLHCGVRSSGRLGHVSGTP